MPLDSKCFNKTIKYLKLANLDQWNKLQEFIQRVNSSNPYDDNNKEYKDIMWREQCYINFPLLYLMSIYLYFYAKEREYTTFLFASRDCCHLYKIFKKLFPDTNVHYFNCSRIMFETATDHENPAFQDYVKSVAPDINRTIFIDLHGTGRRVFTYFDKYYSEVPHCFLLSAGVKSMSDFPEITTFYEAKGKFFNLVFNSRGGPIEMLNYDLIGTLVDYSGLVGPVRKPLEYCKQKISPYHECIEFILNRLRPIDTNFKYDLSEIQNLLKNIFKSIKVDRPIISKYIDHIGRHKESDVNIGGKLLKNLIFDKVLNDTGVYGVIWEGSSNNKPVAIKMVALRSGKDFKNDPTTYRQKSTQPFIHELFEKHKSMTRDAFLHEANQLLHLSRLELSPLVHSFWICDQIHDIHYGFIVMEKMDSSLKDILVQRTLSIQENSRIEHLIEKLHNKGIIHGDLKPSNIGVFLSPSGEIIGCRVFDTQKVKFKSNLSSKQFKRSITRDWNTYHKHYEQNRNL